MWIYKVMWGYPIFKWNTKRELQGRALTLPCEIRSIRNYLSSRQAIPGSSRPSRNSREAPPPVEMWVI